MSLAVGETTTLSARVLDPNGHDIQQAGPRGAGLVVYWKTSDSAMAMVDGSDGREDSETGSSATVTANLAHSFFGTATVTVTERDAWGPPLNDEEVLAAVQGTPLFLEWNAQRAAKAARDRESPQSPHGDERREAYISSIREQLTAIEAGAGTAGDTP